MPVRLCVGDPILVYLNKEDKTQGIGLIKYIGFIAGQAMTEYVGIELLEQCDNGHAGVINGFQYFTAKKKHGIHVRIGNIIRKLTASEIVIKMQEVIEMFKQKLDQYINAVTQRDEYIENLKQSHRDAKSLLKQAYEKIQSLKREIYALKNDLKTQNIHNKKQKATQKHMHNKSRSHSHSSSSSLSNIANLVTANMALEESIETDIINDIDQLNVNSNGPNGKPPKKGRHQRNLSAQLKLDTIDDTYALTTPVADVPLLIDQLVQTMDSKRQSFSTVRTTSPITPMTPVTPSIDESMTHSNCLLMDSVSADIDDMDTPTTITVTDINDSVSPIDQFKHNNYKKNKKGKIYGRSFPDTRQVESNKLNYLSDTVSPKSTVSESPVEASPSPSANLKKKYNQKYSHIHKQKPRHLQHISVGTELTEATSIATEATPDTQYTNATPDTQYTNATPETVQSTNYESDDRGETSEDELSDDELETQLDEGNNTPCWSSSSNSEIEEEEEEYSNSNRTRESYTFSSDSSDADTHLETPKPKTPKKRPNEKRKRKKRRPRKKKSKKKMKHFHNNNNNNKDMHTHTHNTHTHGIVNHHNSSVESERGNGNVNSKKNNHNKKRKSSKRKRKQNKEKNTAVYNNNNNNTANTNTNTNANVNTSYQFPFSSRSQPAAPHHQHNTSMPTMHAQRDRHSAKIPPNISGLNSMNQPPPQHNNNSNATTIQNAHRNYRYMVPQLDNWDVLQQQQQQTAQQQQQATQQRQQRQQQQQQATQPSRVNNIEQINIQNNPYLDQQYFYKQQQQQQQYQTYVFNQQQQQQQQQHNAINNQQQQPVKYGHHKQYFSDSLHYQNHIQQQQQQRHNNTKQNAKKAQTKSDKVYVAPRGGRRSYKMKGNNKNIQMFNIPVKGSNIQYVTNENYM